MATITADLPTSYVTCENTISSWLLTKDHERIALLFFASITFLFFIGGVAARLIRLHLSTPEGLLQPDIYNRMFTMHGIVMVWFFLIPSIPTTLGNFIVPLGDWRPRFGVSGINLASWYVLNLSGLVLLYALIMGGIDTGWTFYTSHSTLFANGYVIAATLAVFINGFSSITTGLNFVVTIHLLRAPGMTWMRLPLFVLGGLFGQPRYVARHPCFGNDSASRRDGTVHGRRHLRPVARR
jgi:cytochrome c oxidase subunit I